MLHNIAFALTIVIGVLFCVAGCASKPPVLPAGTTICTAPSFGEDCLDTYQTFSTFKNNLPCNLCQTNGDSDRNGCAWTVGPGAPNLWCVRNCNICSAVIPTFTKKD